MKTEVVNLQSNDLSGPMRFPKREMAERYYLPSLLKSWPDARVVEYDGAFIIATPDGIALTKADLMLRIFPRGERRCAR